MIASVVARLQRSGANLDDAEQTLFERLLLPNGERPPALAMYAGRGDLDTYVRMAALHVGFKQLSKVKRERGLDAVGELSDPSDDPELAMLKQRYAGPFKKAFTKALSELPAEQQNLLRYHYISGLTTRQIGAITGLHQSNISRRLAQVRATLVTSVRRKLMHELGAASHEVRSLMRLVESQVDVSIERILGQG